MKTAIRERIFETNSSSTHTLTFVGREDYEEDKTSEAPRYRKYRVISDKKGKLWLACGCCHELFVREKDLKNYEDEEERIKECDLVKQCAADGKGDACFDHYSVYYETAIDLLVRVYCELTGEPFEQVHKKILRENDSGRACHMRFFSEGALYDERWDYGLIDDLFWGSLDDVLASIRGYFNDDYVVCYREFYQGIRPDDDE